MTVPAALFSLWALAAPAAQEPPEGGEDSRVVLPAPPEERAEAAPAPTAEPAPPTDPAEPEDTESSRVIGARPKASRAPVKAPEPIPDGTVKRDKDGTVIMPPAQREAPDPVRPERSGFSGVTRAALTSLQVAFGSSMGVAPVACVVAAVPPLICTSFVSPPVALGAGACLWAMLIPMHVITTTAAVWIPALAGEFDPLAGLTAGAAIMTADAVALGAVAALGLLITLRWARAPEGSGWTWRFGSGPPMPPDPRGVDLALAFGLVLTVLTAVLVAPLAGTLTYVGVSALRGLPEAAAESKKPGEAPARQGAGP